MAILRSKTIFIICWLTACYSIPAYAQRKLDSLNIDSIKILPDSRIMTKATKALIKSVKKDAPKIKDTVVKRKSESDYKQYKGAYVRRVTFKQFGFQNRVTDTGSSLANFGSKILNSVHRNSRYWVIRNNMFVDPGDSVRPYVIADNERYLRTLPFLQDARIHIKPVKGSKDSVDLEVVTRDVLSLRGGLDVADVKRIRGNAADINFLGLGQTIQVNALYDQQRKPPAGYSMLYSKNSIWGSFIDVTVGHTTINPNLYDLKEDERAYFLLLNRPLVSPYTLLTGGLYFGKKISENLYTSRIDSLYHEYNNTVFDTWIGYNISGKRMLKSEVRDRKIFAIRHVNSKFDKRPYQVGNNLNAIFNDKQANLAAITFFRQDFYKTNYVYGFGITEDIPYGYNVTVTTGLLRQLYLNRPYAGLKADRYFISGKGDFFRYTLRAGSFYNKGTLQDAGILLGTSMFSRLLYWRKNKIRQYISASYSRLFNTLTEERLYINNPFGLNHFEYQELSGYQRLSASSESSMFINYKFLGFRFAPFVTASASVLTPVSQPFSKSDVYTGIGGGLRTRNENLVFNTIELRFIYFPNTVGGDPALRIMFNTNIRFRYNSNYITPPDIIRWNVDDQ